MPSAPRRLPLVLGLALALTPGAGRAQLVGAPELVRTLAGPGAVHEPAGVAFYGTDLGWTFEHRGELRILFGDTWPTDDSVCQGYPHSDDSQGTLPLAGPPAASLRVDTPPGDPGEFARILLFRSGQPLSLSYGQVPLAGWSDGARAAALFGRGDPIPCQVRESGPPLCRSPETAPGEPPVAPSGKYLRCAADLGTCQPGFFGLNLPCDVATHAGCSPFETCEPSATGFCIDPTSSVLATGDPANRAFAVVHEQEIGVERPGEPAHYDSVARWRTNKFINAGARAVARFTLDGQGADWRPGGDALLVWGRPAWTRAPGQGPLHLYLAVIDLPVARKNGSPRDVFRPLYFAGVDAAGRPRWTRNEAHAAPLAMDGLVGGSPDDVQPIPNQHGIAWVGAPIQKWVMLYSGGAAYNAIPEPGPGRGAIRIRFAEQPWGPWSPAEVHLAPGGPRMAGAPYGPGGVMFHPGCVDQGALLCADPDPHRPLDSLDPACASPLGRADVGILYAPNVIDAWSKPDGAGGFDLYWNVSIWNPYAVLLYRTKLLPE